MRSHSRDYGGESQRRHETRGADTVAEFPLARGISATANQTGSNTMSKLQRSTREAKKQSLLTQKEKKAAKQAKKLAGDFTPFIAKHS